MARAKLPMPAATALRACLDGHGLMQVRVTPNASADAVQVEDGTVLIRTTATPEGGKANDAVLRLLARALGVPGSSVALVRGAASRTKLVRVTLRD